MKNAAALPGYRAGLELWLEQKQGTELSEEGNGSEGSRKGELRWRMGEGPRR